MPETVKLTYTGAMLYTLYNGEVLGLQPSMLDPDEDVLVVHAPFHGVDHLEVKRGETFEVPYDVAHGHTTVDALGNEVSDVGLLDRDGIELSDSV